MNNFGDNHSSFEQKQVNNVSETQEKNTNNFDKDLFFDNIKTKLHKYWLRISLLIVLFITIVCSLHIRDIIYYYKLYTLDQKIVSLNKEENELLKRLDDIKAEKKNIYIEKSFFVNDKDAKIKLFCSGLSNQKEDECKIIINNGDYQGLRKFLDTLNSVPSSSTGSITSFFSTGNIKK